MAYRCIYKVEVITLDGALVMRRYARNKRVATRIAKQCKRDGVIVTKLAPCEHYWVNPDWIEG